MSDVSVVTKPQTIEEFRAQVLSKITSMESDICAVKKDNADTRKDIAEILELFKEVKIGLQFLFKIGNWTGTFVMWAAKVIAASAVVWAAISAAKGIKIPDFGK